MICHFFKKVFIRIGAGEDEFKGGVGTICFKDRLLVLVVFEVSSSKNGGQFGGAVSRISLVPFSELDFDFIRSGMNFQFDQGVPETEIPVVGKGSFPKIFWAVITMQRMAKFLKISKELLRMNRFNGKLYIRKTFTESRGKLRFCLLTEVQGSVGAITVSNWREVQRRNNLRKLSRKKRQESQRLLEGFGYKSSLMNWKPEILKMELRDKEQV